MENTSNVFIPLFCWQYKITHAEYCILFITIRLEIKIVREKLKKFHKSDDFSDLIPRKYIAV